MQFNCAMCGGKDCICTSPTATRQCLRISCQHGQSRSQSGPVSPRLARYNVVLADSVMTIISVVPGQGFAEFASRPQQKASQTTEASAIVPAAATGAHASEKPPTPQKQLCQLSSTPSTPTPTSKELLRKHGKGTKKRKLVITIALPELKWDDVAEPEVDAKTGMVRLARAPFTVLAEEKESDLAFGCSGIKTYKAAVCASRTPGPATGVEVTEPASKKQKRNNDVLTSTRSSKHLRS